MKIYLVTYEDNCKRKMALTACEQLAKKWQKKCTEQGKECTIQKGEIKTQGINFSTWAEWEN